jgi:hypothetical protein
MANFYILCLQLKQEQFRFNYTAVALLFYIVPTTTEEFIISQKKMFYSLLTEIHVPCCQSLCHNCFHPIIIFKCEAPKILRQCSKQMKTAQWQIPLL